MEEYCMKCMLPLEGEVICPNCGHKSGHSSAAHVLAPGTVLCERYLIGEVIGQGGFGITYIGRDLRLNMRIAVKEYYPNGYANRNVNASDSITVTDDKQRSFIEDGKTRFLQEARALARFHGDPGVVDVRDYFEANNTAYIIMEYLEGEDLRKRLKKGTFSADEIFSLMEPIMVTLAKIHKQGVVHRDISPDNIMLLKNGTLKLMDFGAARLVNYEDKRSLSVVLKSGYAPEEQYRPRGDQGPWTDIYALCATIYKCITGITLDDALERGYADSTKWPSELGIHVSARQESVLKKGLAIRSQDRFQDHGEPDDTIQDIEIDVDDSTKEGESTKLEEVDSKTMSERKKKVAHSVDNWTVDESLSQTKHAKHKTSTANEMESSEQSKEHPKSPGNQAMSVDMKKTRKRWWPILVAVGICALVAIVACSLLLGNRPTEDVSQLESAGGLVQEWVQERLNENTEEDTEIVEDVDEDGIDENVDIDLSRTYKITLTADEKMSVKEFNSALDILKGRLAVFAGEEPWQMTVNADQVELQLPQNRFADMEIEQVLQCYLTRGIKLYLFDGGGLRGTRGEDYIPLSRDDLFSVKKYVGEVSGISSEELLEIGVEDDVYPYIKVVLTDECAERISETISTWDEIVFGQDIETSSNVWYYFHTFSGGDGKTFYLIDTDLGEYFSDLVVYNLTHDELAYSFSFSVDINDTKSWEDVEEANLLGENQCNVNDFDEATVTFVLKGYKSDYTDGEKIDLEAEFKERLDSLDIPYAFALDYMDDYTFASVKCPLEHMGIPIMMLLGSAGGFDIQSGLAMEHIYTSGATISCESTDIGTYEVTLQISYLDRYKLSAVSSAAVDNGGVVYLKYEGQPILCTSIDSIIEDGVISFQKICLSEEMQITDDYLWFTRFINTIWNGMSLRTSFNYTQAQLNPGPDGADVTDVDLEFHVTDEMTELLNQIESDIHSVCENASVYTNISSDLIIQAHLDVDENLPNRSLELAKTVFESIDYEHSPFEGIRIFLIDEDDLASERARIIFGKEYSHSHDDHQGYVYAYGIFFNGRLEEYKEEMQQIAETDEFFVDLQDNVSGHNDWIWSW